MSCARARLGLPVASSTVAHFGGEIAFVVERYDRCVTDTGIIRIHQEDMCQAFGEPPTRKYENEGGPGITKIVDFLREISGAPREDARTFIEAIAFNWLVGGTDAHAKNYSILIGAGGRVRLAPLYDVASILPYDEYEPKKIRLAMKLGGNYRIRDITARSWEKLSEELRLDKKEIARRVCEMAGKLPSEAEAIRKGLAESGMKHPVLDRLTERLSAHAVKCERSFAI